MIGEVFGSYRVVQKLDGEGPVQGYLAEHKLTGEPARLFLRRAAPELSPEAIFALLAPPRAAAGLRHPALVEVLDVGWHRLGAAYVIEDHLDGETLAERLVRAGRLAVEEAVLRAGQVAGALDAIHGAGGCHGRLTPAAVFLVADGRGSSTLRVKLLGLAAAALGRAPCPATATDEQSPGGSAPYLAPEQAGGGAPDARSDMYALGCILFEMLCERPPFTGSPEEVLAAHRGSPPPSPSALRPEVTARLERVVLRALAKDPAARFPSTSALAEELRGLLPVTAATVAGVPPSGKVRSATEYAAPPPPAAAQPPRSARRSLSIDVGAVLNDTYRIERVLGRGGMGTVFSASHVRLPKRFAIKVLDLDADDTAAFARFRREAEISSSLGHPNIIEVQDFNRTAAGEPYIVMEYLDGEDLAALVEREAPLRLERVLELTRAIAGALGAAHAAGVVHRDLKPENIFVSRKGGQEVVKVLDFGISKMAGAADLHTSTQSVMGTPGYMSPEQAQGRSAQTEARADQFSLGAIIYEMLSGRQAFCHEGDSVYATIFRIVSEHPQPLEDVPEAVQAVLMRALAKTPEERFPDMAAFLRAFEDAVAGRGGQTEVAMPAALAAPEIAVVEPAPVPRVEAAAVDPVPAPAPAAPASRRIGLVLGGAAALGLAVLLALKLGGKPAEAPARAIAPPAIVSPSTPIDMAQGEPKHAAPSPPPSPAPAADQVTIRLALDPPEAVATLDGAPLRTPSFAVARGIGHVLVVEADGYQPRTVRFAAAEDRTLEVSLKKRQAGARTGPRQRPGPADQLDNPFQQKQP